MHDGHAGIRYRSHTWFGCRKLLPLSSETTGVSLVMGAQKYLISEHIKSYNVIANTRDGRTTNTRTYLAQFI